MDATSQFAASTSDFVDRRRLPRFALEVNIRIYPRNCAVVRGHTVDISESGIAVLLRDEVPIGELVRLEFALPDGDVEVLAVVRQRTAFRYGFQFVEPPTTQDAIGRTCRQLSMDQIPVEPGPHAPR
jgi:c-di-GMP-binding flagellar brake protein YcgR